MRRIGACTAGLHNHSRQFIAAPGFVRPRWDWARVFGPESPCDTGALLRLTERQQSVLRGVSAEVRQTLEKLSSEPSVEGLIHADLHRDNILLDRNRIGFIDFDDCGFGYYMYDVAALLDSFYRRIANGSEEYSALRDAYLTAYDRVCALPPDVEMQLKCFKAMRDMVNINFILSSRNANVQSWGPARVDATLRQMEVFLAGGPCPGM
jgi:Ser/Thr protein kinase RdoA (MazF antagonist)